MWPHGTSDAHWPSHQLPTVGNFNGGQLMALIHGLFQKLFVITAVTGLLMAGWGIVNTPDVTQASAVTGGLQEMNHGLNLWGA